MLLLSRVILVACLCVCVAGQVSGVNAQSQSSAGSTSAEPRGAELTLSVVPVQNRQAKTAKEKEQAEREKKQKEQARQAQTRKTNDNGGVFKPTEEISEDLPAPFPVDI